MTKYVTSFFLILFFSFSGTSFSDQNISKSQKDLSWYFLKRNYDKAEKILESGVSPNFKRTDGLNDLLAKIFDQAYFTEQDLKAVELLIKYKVELDTVDLGGNTILHYAKEIESKNKNLVYEFVRLLKKNGADLNKKNKHGSTPAIEAAKFGNVEYIRALKENGANIIHNNKEEESVATILYEIVEHKRYSKIPHMKFDEEEIKTINEFLLQMTPKGID